MVFYGDKSDTLYLYESREYKYQFNNGMVEFISAGEWEKIKCGEIKLINNTNKDIILDVDEKFIGGIDNYVFHTQIKSNCLDCYYVVLNGESDSIYSLDTKKGILIDINKEQVDIENKLVSFFFIIVMPGRYVGETQKYNIKDHKNNVFLVKNILPDETFVPYMIDSKLVVKSPRTVKLGQEVFRLIRD